ncbi:hypothetical protein GGR56DRAFT_42834 [Xylariaceae sp. FL0804]|nr:hypothetical protein GGR56DRAFT_42834 [Xylariaceae sp. FL0804]
MHFTEGQAVTIWRLLDVDSRRNAGHEQTELLKLPFRGSLVFQCASHGLKGEMRTRSTITRCLQNAAASLITVGDAHRPASVNLPHVSRRRMTRCSQIPSAQCSVQPPNHTGGGTRTGESHRVRDRVCSRKVRTLLGRDGAARADWTGGGSRNQKPTCRTSPDSPQRTAGQSAETAEKPPLAKTRDSIPAVPSDRRWPRIWAGRLTGQAASLAKHWQYRRSSAPGVGHRDTRTKIT